LVLLIVLLFIVLIAIFADIVLPAVLAVHEPALALTNFVPTAVALSLVLLREGTSLCHRWVGHGVLADRSLAVAGLLRLEILVLACLYPLNLLRISLECGGLLGAPVLGCTSRVLVLVLPDFTLGPLAVLLAAFSGLKEVSWDFTIGLKCFRFGLRGVDSNRLFGLCLRVFIRGLSLLLVHII